MHLLHCAATLSPRVEITAAILLRKTSLSETSFIITWLSEAHGKIKTVAKGARRPKSPFAGKLDLFFNAEIQWIRSRKSDLHTLKEVVLTEPFEGLRAQYPRTQLAAYFVELIELVTEPEHATPELYELLHRAFSYLNNGRPTQRALLHFESETVRLLGIHGQPDVTPAVAVGRAFGRLPRGRAELLKQLIAAVRP
ncbi:MAG: repair protein RecO [Chthoniobacter sp.]|nr:repair protein RecO [Chthoniobacter sp.]